MKPTNLLFILSDQHRRDAAGAYGNAAARTPHLDALAERGVRFNNAYTNCPICVPARASLATGRYVHQIGSWDNAFPYDGSVPGWGRRLAEEGHAVDSVGKLHYKGVGSAEGFRKQIVPLNVVDGVGDLMGAVRDDMPIRKGSRESVLEAGHGTSSYLAYDEQIADETIRWLQEAVRRPSEKPWLLFVGFVCPHPPFTAPPDLFEHFMSQELPAPVQGREDEWPRHPVLDQFRAAFRYDAPFTEEQIQRAAAAYYGTCARLDAQIGRVLNALEEMNLDETTRVVYTSDHGESLGSRGLFGKFTMYEESAGVPLIMAGPDVPEGETSGEIVSLVDMYPTFLEALGVQPNEAEADLPGESLWAVANGGASKGYAVSEYHAVSSLCGCYMVREGAYKYIRHVGYPPLLFHLEEDPLETINLAGEARHQEAERACEARLLSILNPEETDARAKAEQRALIEKHGGREAVLRRGTFTNSPAPGEKPQFQSG